MENIEISFPFDSEEIEKEPGSIDKKYDREYLSQYFADYFSQFIGNGVYGKNGGNLEVLSINDNMFLSVNPGAAFINGRGYFLKDTKEIRIPNSDVAFSRIDNIVCRLNMIERYITIEVIQGLASASPVAPDLVRDADYYDLKLAEVYVRNGTDKIKQTDITDYRANSTVCGWVTGVIEQIEATEFFTQYQTAFYIFMEEVSQNKTLKFDEFDTEFRKFMTSSDVEFTTFMERIKDILDENVAGNLLILIDKNSSDIVDLKTYPKFETMTLLAANWSATTPSTYSITDSRYKALTSYWEFTISEGATEAQIEVFDNAEIDIDGSVDGIIKLSVVGVKPTIDLPIMIKIEK